MVLSGLYNASVQIVLPVIVVKHQNACIASCDIVSVQLNMIMINETCGFFISERMGVYFQPNTSQLVTLEGAPGRLGVHTTSCFYLLDEFPGRQNHLRLSGHCNSSADAAMQTAPRDCRFCLNNTHAEYPQIETLLINNHNYYCRKGG